MALTKFGDKTRSIFLNEAEAHKHHIAFTVATGQVVKRAQPVIFTASGDIAPAPIDGSKAHEIIGYSIHNGIAGEEVTIAIRGYAIIWAKANAVQDAGPAMYTGMSSGDDADFSKYATAEVTATTMNGWAVDDATAIGEMIRVILK